MDGTPTRSPDKCVSGQTYLWRKKRIGKNDEYCEVIFINYRPHPGEVMIRDGSAIRRIYRSDLYQKNGSQG